jgi:hypothetical protein
MRKTILRWRRTRRIRSELESRPEEDPCLQRRPTRLWFAAAAVAAAAEWLRWAESCCPAGRWVGEDPDSWSWYCRLHPRLFKINKY